MNTADYLLQAGRDSDLALLGRDATSTYRELRASCARLAGELRAQGLQAGDRVGILAENSLFWAAAYLATLKIGAVAVPLPTSVPAHDLERKLLFVDCAAVCLDTRSYNHFSSVLNPHSRLIFDTLLLSPGSRWWPKADETFDLNQDAALMLTSGTTAAPRAVRITHKNIQANTESIIQYLNLDAQERILVVLPFYYCFGASLLHTHLRVGGSLVLCNTFAYPETALDLIETKDCTGIAGVPSTYQSLLRNSSLPRRQLSTLRKVQQAGGKLPVILVQELVDALPQAQIYVMYGQTEATARLSYLPPELLPSKLGSIGRGIPGVTLRVMDELGAEVKPGEVGEIWAQGENISPGYWNAPEETAEKFAGGFLHTGDLATVDEDGFITVVDRKSDFIKTLGYRVSSQEVEARILEIPWVVAAAAIGEPDLERGEAIKVFVTLKNGGDLSPQDILDHCRRGLARYMVPKEVVIVDHLPTNAHGKVMKTALKNLQENLENYKD